MVCNIVAAKESIDDSIKRAKSLRSVMETTSEGENLDNSLDIALRAKHLLDKREFEELDKLLEEELVSDPATMSVIQKTGGVIEGFIGNNPDNVTEKTPLIIRSAKHRNLEEYGDILELTVYDKNTDKTRTFSFIDGNEQSSVTSSDGVMLKVPLFKDIVSSTISVAKGIDPLKETSKKAKKTNQAFSKLNTIFNESDDPAEILRNSENISDEDVTYDRKSKVKKYQHGSVDDMQNMLADLHALGGRPISNKIYDHYKGLLNRFHEHFFRGMTLYVNEVGEEAGGWVDIDAKKIGVNPSSNIDSGMSNAEVYMHESIHTLVAWALRSNSKDAGELTARLQYLKKQAFDNLTWQDLMKTDEKLSITGAKARFKYIFDNDTSNDEFIAFALTNPGFMENLKGVVLKDKRKTGLFKSILNFFSDIMNAVMGNYKFSKRDSNVQEEVMSLVAALAEINNKAEDDVTISKGIYAQAADVVDRIEGGIEQFLGELFNKHFDSDSKPEIPENPTRAQKILFIAKFFTKGIYNHRYRDMAGKLLTELKIKPNNSIREVFRSVLPGVHDHISIEAEFASLQANNMSLSRNNRVANSVGSILNNFDKTPSVEEEEALTLVIMESNAQTLFTKDKNGGSGYSTEQISKLVGNKAYREKALLKLKRKIKRADSKRYNWLVAQAEGLGIYMATGRGHKAQNSNSANIVKGFLTSERHKFDRDLESLIEEFASLTAIGHQKPGTQKLVHDLIKKEEKGVRNIVNLYGAFIKQSKLNLFKDDASHVLEGYAKELLDDGIETTYAVMDERAELEAAGFELVSVFESNDTSGAKPIGYFVSKTNTRPERLSGAISLGNTHSRGMTLKEVRYAQFGQSKRHAHVWFEADKLKHDLDAIEINKKLNEGVPLTEIEAGPVPVLDAKGQAVDYRNMMSKTDKARLLNQNRKITEVLSKTLGSVVEKTAREEINEKVEKIIRKNIKDVYDNNSSKDNTLEYTLVSPDSEDPDLRRLYYQLPQNIQRIAGERNDNSIPIPSILMDTYFGYSHMRFTDLPGVSALPTQIKQILNQIEDIYMDLVKIVKGNILLKMPVVLAVNVISNVLYAVSTGTNPLELVGEYHKSIKDVHRFMQKHREFEKLSVEMLSLTQSYNTTKFKTDEEIHAYNDSVSRLTAEMNTLNREMSSSPIKELFDLGMYQAVIEDVSMYKIGETNKVADSLDKFLGKMPKAIKTSADWLYLSKDTKWYKANQYILQMSDLVARDIMNRKMKLLEKRQINGKMDLPYSYRKHIGDLDSKNKRRVLNNNNGELDRFLEFSKTERQTAILRHFVNYNQPNGRGEEYLNRLGILMFTKYVKRIQRVIGDVGAKHSIRSAVTMLTAGYGLDLEMIQDQSMFVKAGDDYGLFGLTPIHSPVDLIMTAVNPPLIALGQEALGSR